MESYWFRPIIGGPSVTDLTQPAPGSPGTVATVPSPQHGATTHPFAPQGGLAEAAAQQEPAPLDVQSVPSLVGAGPAIPWQIRQIRQPQISFNGQVTIPASGSLQFILLPFQGTGIIRAVSMSMFDAAFTVGSNLVASLQNLYGQIYFQASCELNSSPPISSPILVLQDVYVPFANGLQLSVLNRSGGASSGNVMISGVWEQ